MQWNRVKAWVGEEETPRHKQKSEEEAAMRKNLVAKVHEHKHRESGLLRQLVKRRRKIKEEISQ